MTFQPGPTLGLVVLGLLYVRAVHVLGRRGYRVPTGQQSFWWSGFAFMAFAFLGPLDVKAQYLQGYGEGEQPDQIYDPNHRPYGLDLKHGGYLELDWMVTPLLGVYGRGDWRDAIVTLGNPASITRTGADRIYITKSWRATGGVRAVINEHIVLKAEYLHNGEYGGVPEIANDVFTSSLLLMY